MGQFGKLESQCQVEPILGNINGCSESSGSYLVELQYEGFEWRRVI